MEFPIGKATRIDYDSATEKKQRVDVAVSNLATLTEDATSQERYISHAGLNKPCPSAAARGLPLAGLFGRGKCGS